MSSIKRTALSGPITIALVRPVMTSCSISSTRAAIQEWKGWDTAPNSSINVTCISRQYLVLGQLEGSLLAWDQDGKSEGELPEAYDSHWSSALWEGISMWPSIWRLAPDVLSPKSLDMAAIDVKLVAVNWKSGFSHSNWVQRPWQEIKQTTWFGLATSLSHCLGPHLYATNRAPSQMGGLSPGTTKLGNLRDSHDPSQLPLPNQIFGILLWVKPTQACQKCDRVHRYARWIGRPSHQSSNLSCPRNLLQKVVIHVLLDTRFMGIQVVTYPTNCQTTEIIPTKKFPIKGLGTCTWINKVHSSSWLYSCSMRGTNIARVEGQWLINRPIHSVPETQMTAPGSSLLFLIYFPPQIAGEITVMSFYDVMIVCSTVFGGETTAHVQRKCHNSSANLLALLPKSPVTITTPEPYRPFLVLNFVPETYIHTQIYLNSNLKQGRLNQIHHVKQNEALQTRQSRHTKTIMKYMCVHKMWSFWLGSNVLAVGFRNFTCMMAAILHYKVSC